MPGDKTEKCYNYGFCIGQTGVTEEWLNYKAKTARKYTTIFYRDESTLNLAGIPKTSRENIEIALERQVLIVSLGAKLKVAKCKLVRDWFLNNEFSDFGHSFMNLFPSHALPEGFADHEEGRKKVIKYFSSFDETIKGFEVTKLSSQEDPKEEKYRIDSLHKKIGSDEMGKIPLSYESAGTLKMFALYPELQSVMKNGGVYFIDDLNASLHPLLVRKIITLFNSAETNPKGAQLLFTTHDTFLLSAGLFRRDQVWFTQKDNFGATEAYSLAEYKVRGSSPFERDYLQGKFGATPIIGDMETIFKAEE